MFDCLIQRRSGSLRPLKTKVFSRDEPTGIFFQFPISWPAFFADSDPINGHVNKTLGEILSK